MVSSSWQTVSNVAELSQVGFDPTLDEDRKTPVAYSMILTHHFQSSLLEIFIGVW